jgi:hypothetical protein
VRKGGRGGREGGREESGKSKSMYSTGMQTIKSISFVFPASSLQFFFFFSSFVGPRA